ncbi:MAG TPA: urease accessory protein UreD [Bryobacteraceae bacterium]|jgi:urease accessory protein|nr:urease accessory protein UreD [Bryobacteraceae bacterium]
MPNLHLSFEANAAGATILRVKQQQPPWRVVRGFQAASGELLAHVHNVSGGILDTDSLDWRIDVADGAQAQVTSTGATRVYRSRAPGRIASQRAAIALGENAYLEYLPDQLIPFAGSRFDQSLRVELARGASLILWDRIAPGREASGELFRYESLASSVELAAGGEPIAVEHWSIAPMLRQLAAVPRLGPFRYFSSCYICRSGEPAPYWRAFESEMQQVADRLSGPDVLWGVTSLRSHGIVARGVATSGRSLADGLVEIWKAAKWHLCGRVATLPRKVH